MLEFTPKSDSLNPSGRYPTAEVICESIAGSSSSKVMLPIFEIIESGA